MPDDQRATYYARGLKPPVLKQAVLSKNITRGSAQYAALFRGAIAGTSPHEEKEAAQWPN
jgi:hypothetical protein